MKKGPFALGVIAIIISAIMFIMAASNPSHLDELFQVFWMPLLLGLLLIGVAYKKDKTSS